MRSGGFDISGLGGFNPYGFGGIGFGGSFNSAVFSLTGGFSHGGLIPASGLYRGLSGVSFSMGMDASGRGSLYGGNPIMGGWSKFLTALWKQLGAIDSKRSGRSGSGRGDRIASSGGGGSSAPATAPSSSKSARRSKTTPPKPKPADDKSAEVRTSRTNLAKHERTAAGKIRAKGYKTKDEIAAIKSLAKKHAGNGAGCDETYRSSIDSLPPKYVKSEFNGVKYAEWAAARLDVTNPHKAMVDQDIVKVYQLKGRRKFISDYARVDKVGTKTIGGVVYEKMLVRKARGRLNGTKYIYRKYENGRWVWGKVAGSGFVRLRVQPKEYDVTKGLIAFKSGNFRFVAIKRTVMDINSRLAAWKESDYEGDTYTKRSATNAKTRLEKFFGKRNGKPVVKVEVSGNDVHITVLPGKNPHETGRRYAFVQDQIRKRKAEFDNIIKSVGPGAKIIIDGKTVDKTKPATSMVKTLGQNAVHVFGPIAIRRTGANPDKPFVDSHLKSKGLRRAFELIAGMFRRRGLEPGNDYFDHAKQIVVNLRFGEKPSPAFITTLQKALQKNIKQGNPNSKAKIILKYKVVGTKPLEVRGANYFELTRVLNHAAVKHIDKPKVWSTETDIKRSDAAYNRLIKGSADPKRPALRAENYDQALKTARMKLHQTAIKLRAKLIRILRMKGHARLKDKAGFGYAQWFMGAKSHLKALLGDKYKQFSLDHIEGLAKKPPVKKLRVRRKFNRLAHYKNLIRWSRSASLRKKKWFRKIFWKSWHYCVPRKDKDRKCKILFDGVKYNDYIKIPVST